MRKEVAMFMSREVVHCRPGKAKELVARFKQLSVLVKEMGYSPMRIYTDVSGEQFWTVVVEQEIKTLEEMGEIMRKAMLPSQQLGQAVAKM
jgi:hypothetical protein